MTAKTQLSKADKIRKILHLSNAEIAKREECHEGYVRAVRQRTDSEGRSIPTRAELAWSAANREFVLQNKRDYFAKRYADPEYRKHKLESGARWRDANRDYRNARQREYYRKRRAEARAS